MINEFHSLLINREPGDHCFSIDHGDTQPPPAAMVDPRLYVPDNYRVRTLSTAEQVARDQLFGSNPDYHYLSYRLSQIYPLVFCGKYASVTTQFDPRTTVPTDWKFPIPAMRTEQVGQERGRFDGDTPADDVRGRSLFSVRLALSDTRYTVLNSSRPVPPPGSAKYGQKIPGETWWLNRVPGPYTPGGHSSTPNPEIYISRVNKPTKQLYSVYLSFTSLADELLRAMAESVPLQQQSAITAMLLDTNPWYEKLAGWLSLLALTAKNK